MISERGAKKRRGVIFSCFQKGGGLIAEGGLKRDGGLNTEITVSQIRVLYKSCVILSRLNVLIATLKLGRFIRLLTNKIDLFR